MALSNCAMVIEDQLLRVSLSRCVSLKYGEGKPWGFKLCFRV